MKKLLRTRAAVGDRDLLVVTDEDATLAPDITEAELRTVVDVLANKVRAFYAVADKQRGRQPCSHELDEAGENG
jgi:hypothetical protein